MDQNKICTNCGEIGHEFKICVDPITSFGIINIRLNNENNENFIIEEKFSAKKNDIKIITSKKYSDIQCNISFNLTKEEKNESIFNVFLDRSDPSTLLSSNNLISNNYKFWYYRNRIQFLMVSRNFSLGFIEFIRGRYDVSDTKAIIDLFEQMNVGEINIIHKNNYDDILYYFLNRHDETKDIVLNRIYEGKYSLEYCEAKIKFNMLRNAHEYPENDIPWDIYFYTRNVKPKWTKSEWGFPKGRREKRNEDNLICARREFEEETGYTKNEYLVLNKIEPIEEIMTGTNGISYKHVYYVALDKINSDQNNLNNTKINYDKYEICEVKWFTYDDAISHIRPYHNEKKIVLTNIYMFIINSLIHADDIIDY